MSELAADCFKLTPLGAGKEVGRSCFYCKYTRAGVHAAFLLDCGINPSISEDNALSDVPALPFFDLIDEPLDFILITHFHNDHISGLPFLVDAFLNQQITIPPIYMTEDTRKVAYLNFNDQIKSKTLFHAAPEGQRENIAKLALKAIEQNIQIVSFNEFRKVKNNVYLTTYAAGHVMGAAMFLLEIAGFKVLYTGDWSAEKDYSLKPAELPAGLKPDILVTEGTYGTLQHSDRELRESSFIKMCVDTLARDGRVLLPVFAVGRVQELLAILNNYWKVHQEMQKYYIYYISSIGKEFAKDTPFVKYETNQLMIQRNVPCIVFATPGMLQQGVSRQLFEDYCISDKNLLLITGYGADGSYLSNLLERRKVNQNIMIMKKDGSQQQVKMKIEEISFSAHSDIKATMHLIETVQPKNLVLIHGSKGALEKLSQRLNELYITVRARIAQYKDENPTGKTEFLEDLGKMKIFVPDNGETLSFDIVSQIEAVYQGNRQFEQYITDFSTEKIEEAENPTDIYLYKQPPNKLHYIYLKQEGIEFTLIDTPTEEPSVLLEKIGCDCQMTPSFLLSKLQKLFSKQLVLERSGSYDCGIALIRTIIDEKLQQFDIMKLLQEPDEQSDEQKQQVESLEVEEIHFSLFKNNNRQLVEKNREGFYLEISGMQENQELIKFMLDKFVGLGKKCKDLSAQEFASYFSDSSVVNERTVQIGEEKINNFDLFWYPDEAAQLDKHIAEQIMDINLVALIDL